VAVKTDLPFFFGFLTVSELFADTDENASAQAEFLFGYSRIGYFGEGSVNLDDSTVAKSADILIFGAYGTSSEICFFREDFFGDSVRILCASPTLFPFTDLERIVFSSIATAYLPMRTAIP
jgi:hypothetical protein